ncbi:hypothetical protein IC7_01401 [Bacillus cereus BAG1O-1]|nr:hypothetical protein IC7_01401 [Bacillus cereus BAG1O-1]
MNAKELELSYFPEDEFRKRLEFTIHRLSKNKTKQTEPVAFLLGGQPGSGKTTLHRIIKERLNDNVIIIDNDALKPLHPDFDLLVEEHGQNYVEYVKPFSNKLTEELIEHFSNEGFNLVIEGTLRTTETPTKTATSLKGKGYEVNLYVMAVSKWLSYLGTVERYELMYVTEPETARATDESIHDTIVSNIPENLETLFKSGFFTDISLFKRDGTKIYSSVNSPSVSPKQIIEEALNERIPRDVLGNKVDYIIKLITQNNNPIPQRIKRWEKHSRKFRVKVESKKNDT